MKNRPMPFTGFAGGRRSPRPAGKVLVLVMISMSAILGIVGLVFDAGMMMTEAQNLKQAADAAATAGAMDLRLGKTSAAATNTATSYLQVLNGLSDAQVSINIPPLQGSFAGRSGYLEIVATRQYFTRVSQILGANPNQTLTARSVSGYQPSTATTAIMVLDPNPAALSLGAIPSVLPSLPALIGGLEVRFRPGNCSSQWQASVGQYNLGRRRSEWKSGRERAWTTVWRRVHAAAFVDALVCPGHSSGRWSRQPVELRQLCVGQ